MFCGKPILQSVLFAGMSEKGYGTFIMNHIERQIADEYDKVYLGASMSAALYEKYGFVKMEDEMILGED